MKETNPITGELVDVEVEELVQPTVVHAVQDGANWKLLDPNGKAVKGTFETIPDVTRKVDELFPGATLNFEPRGVL